MTQIGPNPPAPGPPADPFKEEPVAVITSLCHAQIGSSLSPIQLMVGWEDDVGRERGGNGRPSELIVLPEYVWIQLFPTKYATDALQPLQLEFNVRDITKGGVVLSCTMNLGPGGRKCVDVTFHLHRPPRFWVLVNGVRRRDTLLDGGYEGDGEFREGKGFRGVSSLGEESALRIGRWLSYRLTFPEDDLPQLKAGLKELGLLRVFPPLKPSQIASWALSKQALLPRVFPKELKLPFHLKYTIDSLLSFGILIDVQVNDLLEALRDLGDDEDKKERILLTFFREARIWDIKKAVMDVKSKILSRPLRAPQSHMVYIAKAVITPTRILAYPPELQTSNFVLRRFALQVDQRRFIRVQLWDEGNRLHMHYESKTDDADVNEGIVARFRRCLKYGIKIGGRIFKILDYSASQARNASYWAIAEDREQGFTCDAVREAIGDFSEEKIVAKNAARRGQLYSTTRAVGIVRRVRTIVDFTTTDGSSTFTDGVGICNQELAKAAALELGISEEVAARTTAIQFRKGGAKGVAAAWPPRPMDANGIPLFQDLPWPKVKPHSLLLRPSQIKFASSHAHLGVVKVRIARSFPAPSLSLPYVALMLLQTSGYSYAYLNREVISLIYPRGIRHSDIMGMFETQIEEIAGTELSLEAGDGWRPFHERLFNGSKFPILPLIETGFHHEPFVRAIARLFVNRSLWNLKWKARVHVEKGVNGLGVVDELGVLEEGQVFCRTINHRGEDRIVTGKCIIFRAPTRHPGDVQVVEAVDHPALQASGLNNVIVFNRRGQRDLPSMLGGGDLDGDDYTLIWDERLTSIREEEPMNYSPPVKPTKVEEVSTEQIVEFHTTYMKKDMLGAVSNAHLAMSDYLGPDHEDCRELCMIHSTAVDFAKTGVAPEFPHDLRPEKFPDFMGPRRRGWVYESQKPLGLMFRHSRLNPFPELKPVSETFLDPRLGSIQVDERIVEIVQKLKDGYDIELQGLMVKYYAREEEVVAGLVLEMPGGLKRLDKDNKLRDPLTMAFEALRLDFIDAGRKVASSTKPRGDDELTPIQLVAVASYQLSSRCFPGVVLNLGFSSTSSLAFIHLTLSISTMSVVHVVLFKPKPTATEEELQSFIDFARSFDGEIPGLVSMRAGKNLPGTVPRAKGYDIAIVAVLEKQSDLPIYAKHPKHQELLAKYRVPYIEVLFKPKASATPAQLQSFIDFARGMVGQIPGLVSIRVGRNLPITVPRAKGYDIALMAILERQSDLPIYANHPVHQQLLSDYRTPYIDDVLAFDFDDTNEAQYD
ncbi:hypothetical protein MNV49_000266 [Pseudohyphozyma bogoriensis]|nr:hypothetical protein MNV49_000266 [Pseudohyphozyma bogoriensis]